MPDYLQELVPPDFRNLVINPGGEATPLGSTYTASNGAVRTGAAGVGIPAPASGAGVIEYEVLDNTSLSYFFAPLGPAESVHRGGFRIPAAGSVSARVKLRASASCWLQIQAAWATELWVDGQPAGLSAPIRVDAASTPTSVGTGGWTTVEVFVAPEDVPAGATHWRPLVAVFSSNPATTPTPPAVGLRVWADEFFVSDSGADLSGVPYVDGDQTGYAWEGPANYSSSVPYVAPLEDPDPGDEVAAGGVDQAPDAEPPPDPSSAGTPAAPLTPNPLAPVVPDAAMDDPGGRPAGARAFVAEAEDVLGRRNGNRRLCLNADVEIEGLVLNTMDDTGTVWLVSDIEGWWTTPEPEVPDVPRAWFDGSFETRGRYGARTFTLTGSFVPRSPAGVAPARDRLIRAVDLVHRGGWFMTHEKPGGEARLTKGAKVWMVGQPLISTQSTSGKTDFSIAFRAPDSLKHSIKDGIPPGYDSIDLITSGSSYPERPYPREYPWAYPDAVFGSTVAIIQNFGNAVTWPILRMAGPTNGPVRIYNADTLQEFRIVRQLYPGEILEIDCFTRQVTLNGEGNYRFYLDVDVDWLMLQPGPNKISFTEEEPGALRTTLGISWRSSWIG